MLYLIFRQGPAPGDTEDARGTLHAALPRADVVSLTDAEALILFGDGTAKMEAFVNCVRNVWGRTVARGDGHLLVGLCTGFTTGPPGATSCREVRVLEGALDPAFEPRDYLLLYAVARVKEPPGAAPDAAPATTAAAPAVYDVAIDYRGLTGPDDPGLVPFIFAVPGGAPAGPP